MENRKMVPEIRFSGFTDPWEQRKLLGCIEKITDFRGRTPKKLGMDWNESGYLALSALNVKDGYIDFSQNVHYGDQALYNEWMSGNELHEGQVLFTTEAPMGNVAQVPDNKRYILSQRTIAFDVKEDVITENFLATLLRSPAVFNTLTSLSSGGTAKGVSQKSLAGVDVQVPVDLKEQTLLADYFHSLNNLITLHQRKLEKLKTFKKAMLDKMFPKNGKFVPEIRFSGFTDPWEQRKLGEVGKARSGVGFPDTEQGGNYGIPFFKVSDMNHASNENEMNVANNYVTDAQIALYGWSPIDELPAIFFAKVGAAVMLNRKRLCYVPFLLDNNTMAYSLRKNLWNANFAKALFETVDLTSLVQVGALPSYNARDVEAMEIMLPNISEQEKIGQYFHQLDNFITLHQRKLEKLQNIKKSMLNKMFI